MKIPITRPYFGKDEISEVTRVIRSGWVMQGPRVEGFEKVFAKYIGAKYAVATSSGTTALHLGLLAAGVDENDEVITTAFSFIATANAVLYCGAYPVFCDIDLKTYNLDAAKVRSFIETGCSWDQKRKILTNRKTKRRLKAILPVDQVGMPADMESFIGMARKYGLSVIDDAACALGSTYKGKMVGGMADISCFSFHPRKIITTAEGGMITTDDKKIAESMKVLRSHGQDKDGAYSSKGYNYRMSDLHAALGLAQMGKLDKILSARRAIATKYDRALKGIETIEIPYVPGYAAPNYQSYTIRVLDNSKISARELAEKLAGLGIAARKGITAIHREPCYRKLLGDVHLPNTEKANKSMLMLPIYPSLTRKGQDYVIDCVKKICGKH